LLFVASFMNGKFIKLFFCGSFNRKTKYHFHVPFELRLIMVSFRISQVLLGSDVFSDLEHKAVESELE